MVISVGVGCESVSSAELNDTLDSLQRLLDGVLPEGCVATGYTVSLDESRNVCVVGVDKNHGKVTMAVVRYNGEVTQLGHIS